VEGVKKKEVEEVEVEADGEVGLEVDVEEEEGKGEASSPGAAAARAQKANKALASYETTKHGVLTQDEVWFSLNRAAADAVGKAASQQASSGVDSDATDIQGAQGLGPYNGRLNGLALTGEASCSVKEVGGKGDCLLWCLLYGLDQQRERVGDQDVAVDQQSRVNKLRITLVDFLQRTRVQHL
jgi:hypothetical protein